MTFIGIWQDLAMIWLWLWALVIGAPHFHASHFSLLRAAPTLVNISKVAPGPAPIRHCTYLFEGTASSRSVLLPHARVMVRLVSPHGRTEKVSTADAQGKYSLELGIDTAHHEPVDWSMHTDTTDGLGVELVGRRIAMDEDRIIRVRDGRDSAPVPTRQLPVRYTPSSPYEEASIG